MALTGWLSSQQLTIEVIDEVVLEQDTTQPEETLLAQTVKEAVIHLSEGD
jgi:hypothetical protein